MLDSLLREFYSRFHFQLIPLGDFVVILSTSSGEFGCSRFNEIKEINSFIVVGEFLLLLTGPNSRGIHFQFDASKVLLELSIIFKSVRKQSRYRT